MFESPLIDLLLIGLPILLFVFSLFLRKWFEKRIKRLFQMRKIVKKRKENPCYHCPSVRKHHCNGCFRRDLMKFEETKDERSIGDE